jgi:hypothetical protein
MISRRCEAELCEGRKEYGSRGWYDWAIHLTEKARSATEQKNAYQTEK